MILKFLNLSFVVTAAALFFSGIFISTETSADHGPEKMWKRQIKPYFTAHETGNNRSVQDQYREFWKRTVP